MKTNFAPAILYTLKSSQGILFQFSDNKRAMSMVNMVKIYFYAPPSHVEAINEAMFMAGAGKIGRYSHCAWQVLGEGQFMPLEGNDAFVGTKNCLEKIAEYKVEMVCETIVLSQVITALKKAHPYEEPAYQVCRIEDI